MAPRIGFTRRVLRGLDPAACDTDVRLVWCDDARDNVGVVLYDGTFLQLHLSGVRELRLLGKQIFALLEHIERDSEPFEVVVP